MTFNIDNNNRSTTILLFSDENEIFKNKERWKTPILMKSGRSSVYFKKWMIHRDK